MAIRTLGQSLVPTFFLYHTDTTLGWRILRHVAYREGEKKVARGLMRRVLDAAGNHIGYQPVTSAAARMDLDVPSQPSPASISAGEMRINAEEESATAGMAGHRRDERMAAGRAPEDRVERVIRKVQVYAHVGAAKGDILRVWPAGASEPLTAGA
ncbi:MAG: hypothetical protein WAM66_12290 [Acidobacteriaceae bacterium]